MFNEKKLSNSFLICSKLSNIFNFWSYLKAPSFSKLYLTKLLNISAWLLYTSFNDSKSLINSNFNFIAWSIERCSFNILVLSLIFFY
jgi:hypothetical protein